jgi:acetyl esterase/lipase
MRHSSLAVAALLAAVVAPIVQAEPIDLATYKALPRPAPTTVLSYGSTATQAVDVFRPEGVGPFPVVVLIHGGCWRDLPGAGREQLRHLGADLARRGIATWNIGYRRADENGGGYPGTFEDVATAVDRLRDDAARYDLDLTRAVAVGHSAGGHLALWAAARHRLPAESPLRRAEPFIPRAVISLGGIGDLDTFARLVPVLCGPGVIEKLAPAGSSAEISPAALPPPDGAVVMVSGILDRLVPPYVARDYARAMRHKPDVALVDIPEAGHFDLVTPGTAAWEQVRRRIVAALDMDRTDGAGRRTVPGKP